MKFFRTGILPLIFVGIFFLGFSAHAASFNGTTFDVQPRQVTSTASTLNYVAKIVSTESEIRQLCGGTSPNILWHVMNINDTSVNPFDDPNIEYAHGSITAPYFLNNPNKQISGNFKAQTWFGGTSLNFELDISCGAGSDSNKFGKLVGRSSVIPVALTGQATGGLDNFKFDAQPRNLDSGTSGTFNFTLTFTGSQTKIQSKCGTDPIVWQVYKFLNTGDHGYSSNNEVSGARGGINPSDFGNGTTITKNASANITSPSGDFTFVARVTCSNGDQLTVSSPVPVTSGGRGTAVCGNNVCETGETQESCPADCKPGQTKKYSFEITNPLKGGANDFSSLVKIIAQWIFNLAIPIAVAMIVYAGILFLTAAGDTSKVTKAREVLTYAVIGLAIILIGNGFVTLIQSILELGSTTTTNTTTTDTICIHNACSNGVIGACRHDSDCKITRAKAVGEKCSKPGDCFTGLTCKDEICQRETGNKENEPCVSTRSCDVGLTCDRSDPKIIDGQTLGSCFQP